MLLGTAYLFTDEAVALGAIVPGMQRRAIECSRTVLLESAPGQQTRCADTEYVQAFAQERARLVAESRSPEEVHRALEDFNIGRLRIAAKGVTRQPRPGPRGATSGIARISAADQRMQGLYMMGQLASLRGQPVAMEELHRDVCEGSARWLDALAEPTRPDATDGPRRPCDVAIVGMSCLLPKAPDLDAYWQNILSGVDAITEVPSGRWDWRRYFDPNPAAPDHIYSRWGGFLDDVAFDPLRFGIPPTSLPSIEPLQLLTLEAVNAALADAGYSQRPFERRRASVILGVSGGVSRSAPAYR
jgi:beta-ketoacyl synthase-like protein